MQKRSIVIEGHRTSVALEPAFWAELAAIAKARNVSLNALVAQIDHAKGGAGNLASALRLHVLDVMRGKISRA